MGPQSAGALPGPICYNKGGTLPTCTDANLILGYLNPEYVAGGKIKLDLDKTKKLLKEDLSAKLGLSLVETAAGMFKIINMNMAQGVRQISIERGYDPREFLIIVAGGAGPIHAGEICKELEIPMFIVPDVSSIFCAAGMLLGDLKHDYVRSYLFSISQIEKSSFMEIYEQMKNAGVDTLNKEGVKKENIEFYPVLDLRYIGQYHEVQLSVPWKDVESFDFENIKETFHSEHNRLFGYSLKEEGTEIEIINVRLRVIGKTKKPMFISEAKTQVLLQSAFKEKRKIYIPETNEIKEVNVYNGDIPLNGNIINGPAMIEKVNTSIFVSENYDCRIDMFGSFIIYNKEIFPNGFKKENASMVLQQSA